MAKTKTSFAKGNDASKKLKNPDLKAEAYRQYCAYLATGKSKQGWYFDHPELTLTWETMEKYIRENPADFEPNKKKLAESRSFETWEGTGMKMLMGEMKAETALYQLFMRNKFGWDKQEANKEVSPPEFDQQLQVIKPAGEP